MNRYLQRFLIPLQWDYRVLQESQTLQKISRILKFIYAPWVVALGASMVVPALLYGASGVALSYSLQASGVVMLAFIGFRHAVWDLQYNSAVTVNETLLLASQNRVLNSVLDDFRLGRFPAQNYSLELTSRIQAHYMEPAFAQLLDNMEIPHSLRCPISMNIMHYPVRGQDGHFYDRLSLLGYFFSSPLQKTYPLNSNIILQDPILFPLDTDKFLEVQHFKRCLEYDLANTSVARTAKAIAKTSGPITVGLFALTALTGNIAAIAVSLGVGLVAGASSYYRERYADRALNRVRRHDENEEANLQPNLLNDTPAYHAGKSASVDYFAYAASFIPAFQQAKLAYEQPQEWYAGLQAENELQRASTFNLI